MNKTKRGLLCFFLSNQLWWKSTIIDEIDSAFKEDHAAWHQLPASLVLVDNPDENPSAPNEIERTIDHIAEVKQATDALAADEDSLRELERYKISAKCLVDTHVPARIALQD